MLTDAPTREQLARDIFTLAQRGGMPDTYWRTDSRIARACAVLGVTPEHARVTDWDSTTVARVAASVALDVEPEPEDIGEIVPSDFDDLVADGPDPVEPAASLPGTTGPTEVWTDGACRHNPGPGGWGWVTPDGRQDSGALAGTTNNVMEITAAFEAIKAIPERPLVVVSDSSYVVDAFNKRWWSGWIKRDWKTAKGEPVANKHLWEPFIDLVVFGGVTADQNPNRKPVDTGISFRWVKGHAGHALNEAADRLAVAARETLPDQGRPHSGGRHGGRGRR